MAGIQHDTLSDIQEIRRLLDGYSEGFTFIKELIQNADDAEANEIRLVWHPGMNGDASHKLLNGPALVVMNDGPFEPKHRDGLMRMGLGSKASDEDRIGRFGLGMKAVFHVCEGFFFLEHTGDNELMEFFSPWHPEHHAEWELEKESNDWQLLRKTAEYLKNPSWKRWFAVWIPLRTKQECGEIDPIRNGADAFPGDEREGCPEALKKPLSAISPRLGETLVFLQNVKMVTFSAPGSETVIHHNASESHLSHGAKYYRLNTLPCSTIASEWQKKPAWPKVFRIGDRLSSEQVPDKARWEASVAISVNRDHLASGTLRVFWNVFLPVGDEPYEEILLPDFDGDLHIFLHGYFFLNDSRTHVYGVENGFQGADENHQTGIRIAWNKALATSEDGMLPLVIPALEDCFHTEQLADQMIQQIIAALSASRRFAAHRQDVAKKKCFGRFLQNGKWSWCSLPVTTRVLLFPLCGNTENTAERILARLLPESAEIAFALEGGATLSAHNPEVKWTAADLDRLCVLLTREDFTFESSDRLYIRSILEDHRIPTSSSTGWMALPIYEVRDIGKTERRTVTANEINTLLSNGGLFRSGLVELEVNLAKACPKVEAGFIRGFPPPGATVPELNNASVAGLVANQETLGIASDRLELVKSLTTSGQLSPTTTAIRYLLHGCWVHADNSTSALLFNGGDWETHVRPLLDALRRSWCWVDPLFQGELSEHQMEQLVVHPCGADDFRNLCDEPEIGDLLPSLQLHESHDFLLANLNAGETDDELLRRLPIHSLGENLHTAVVEGVWLAPNENPITRNPGSWNQLRSQAKIVGRCDNLFLALRQEQVFTNRVIDRDGIIRLAAQQPEPTTYALLILECLAQRTPSRDAANALKASQWLPLRKGGACKLEQIIWIKDAEEELDRVTSQLPAESDFVTRSDLAIDWEPQGLQDGWRIGAWGTIVAFPLIPSKGRLVEILRDAVVVTPSVHLGIEQTTPQEIEVWLEAVDGIEADFSNSAYVIRRLFTPGTAENPQLPEWIVHLGRLFFHPWTGEEAKRYDTALEALRQRHENSGATIRERIDRIFDRYLAAAYTAGRWDNEYSKDPDFTLLSQDGTWTLISQLAAPVSGIARSALLQTGSAEALGLSKSVPPTQDDQSETKCVGRDESLMDLLEVYHKKLDESVSPRLWGMFLALLGQNVRDLADSLTEGRTDTIREELVGPHGSAPRTQVVVCNYECRIVTGNTVTLIALNGSSFAAPRDMAHLSLLVPQADAGGLRNQHFIFIVHDRIPYRVSFNLLDPQELNELTPRELRNAIERTIQILQSEVLGVDESRRAGVRGAIDKFEKLDQKSLGMAQQEILATCRMHLTQLAFPISLSPKLAGAIRCLEEADQCEAEARENREFDLGDWRQLENSARSLKDSGIQRLRNVLENNGDLHSRLAKAMRGRIKQDGYHPGSIPFELFQNADDALAELPTDSTPPLVFIAEFGIDDARFGHWGRPINHPVASDENSVRSSTRDLVKMLILHGSDKQVDEGTLSSTGKFGLGFKSVYRVTDRPEVLSKDLSFEVVGATFPKRLAEAPRLELLEWLEKTMPGNKSGTAIRLPLATPPPPDFENLFRKLSPYLPVFARKIRKILIHGEPSTTHHWRPQIVHQAGDWSLQRGDVCIDGQVHQLLHLKYRDVSWLFGLDHRGITRIKDIPCLWITAPTMEADDLGFAINGPFEPHPGRTQLNPAGEEVNLRLFRLASEALEKFLNWSLELGDKLGTLLSEEAGIDQDSFWRAVWELFSRTDGSNADKTARSRILDAIWAHGTGYRKIIESHPVIPNGLPGNLHTLTSAATIGFETKGFMAYKSGLDLLEDAFLWAASDATSELRITSQEIVSSKVASMLRTRLEWDEPLASFSLPFFLRRLVGIDSRVIPALCGKLGLHLNSSGLFPENSQNPTYNWPGDEKATFVDFLSELHFQCLAGSWFKAERLLISTTAGFEGIRAGFAPPERVLHTDYSSEEKAHDFFRLSRGEMKVAAHDLSLWLQESAMGTDTNRRLNALLFLASQDPLVTDAAGGVSEECKEVLVKSPEFARLSLENQNRVHGSFQLARIEQTRKEGRLDESPWLQTHLPGIEPDEEDEATSGPSIEASSIIDEWDEELALRLFTVAGALGRLVVPDSIADDLIAAHLSEPDSPQGKAAWYRLLCLGCTLGLPLGIRPLDFVTRLWNTELTEEFWRVTIPDPSRKLPAVDFNRNLDAFFDAKIHMLFRSGNASGENAGFWRRVFYDFRKMHHFVFMNQLPETILEFASYTETDGRTLVEFLKSGQIPITIQDVNTPRFRGVIGQSMTAPLLFVMRELRRLGVLNDRFDSACYYMNSPARRIARGLGWLGDETRYAGDFSALVDQSEIVHNRMRDEIPELVGHFDLPLQLYSYNHPR